MVLAVASLVVVASPARAAAPQIFNVDPREGPVGTTVTIDGSGLDGVTEVLFDGVAAPFTIESPTLLTTEVPSGATAGPLTVRGPDGEDAFPEFLVIERPRVDGFTPHQGSVGTVVRVHGDHLGFVTRVWFGQELATFSRVSYTRLKVKVPGGFRDARIRVRSRGGTARSDRTFHVQR